MTNDQFYSTVLISSNLHSHFAHNYTVHVLALSHASTCKFSLVQNWITEYEYTKVKCNHRDYFCKV